MASLFGVGVPAVSKHMKNILEEGELDENSVVSKMEITAADGKNYQTQFYNLDDIISVGYRVNSSKNAKFRIWATSVLKDCSLPVFFIPQLLRPSDCNPIRNMSTLSGTLSTVSGNCQPGQKTG